jgi:serine/threonine protein kinase
MGSVYLADQFAINRKVALKILQPDYARDQDFVKRFRQEATLAASFSHQNVVTVFDFDQADDGSLYIVMEYVDGRSLSEVIQDIPMEVGRALHLGIQIAEGLSAAHRAGVIHRDIKPENIMVVEGGENIKLMDFGIARLRDNAAATRLTQTGMIMGTPAYMAPEQIEGGELSDRTDIYAFGIVIYEMLAGRVPFKASTPGAILIKHLHETPIPLSKVRKEIPPSVERIVVQALQKSPEKRLGSMDEVVEALKKAQRELEQQSTGGVNLIAPQMSAVRRGLAAVATPFRRLLGMGPSGSTAPKRNYETDLEDHQPVFDQHERPPETSFSLTTPGKGGDIAAPTYRESHDVPRVHSSEIADRLEKPEAQVTDRPIQWGDQAPGAGDMAKMSASPAAETIAETVAFTQPIQVQEQIIQGQEIVDDYTKFDAEPSIEQETPATAEKVAPTNIIDSLEASHIDDSAVAAGLQQPETQIIDRLRQPEHHASVAGEMTATSTSLSSETMAETVTFTQPIEKVTTQRRGWLVAAITSVFVILIGLLGGVTVFRYVSAPPSTPAVKTEPLDVKESVAVLPRAESQGFTQERNEDTEERRQVPPVAASPQVNITGRPVSKGLPVKEGEKLALKPAEKSPSSPAIGTVERPDSQIIKEGESKERGKATKPDQEQKPYPSAVVEVETKKPDSPSKKMQKASPEPRIASLKQPEAPPPPPISRVELRDLSIISNKRELKVKERVMVTARGRYSDGKEIDITAGVQWKSSDASVVSVNSRGELEGLKEGKAQISAIYDGVASPVYTYNVKATEIQKSEESGEPIKDLRRRLLR